MKKVSYNEDDVEVNKEKKRFSAFCKELGNLSLKYDITVQAVGGVLIYDEGSLIKVVYDDDWSSGDLMVRVKTVDD